MRKLIILTAALALVAGVASAGTINVDINDGSCVSGTGQPDPYGVVYCSIQDAITDAAAGDVIQVAAGTYQENLASWKDMEIIKSLSLIGAGSGSTIIELSEGNGLGGKMNGIEIRGSGLTVSLQGLTLTRRSGNTYATSYPIRVAETSSSFNYLSFVDVEVEYAEASDVILGSNGSFTEIYLEDCSFHHAGTWGFLGSGTISKITVLNSDFEYNGQADAAHGVGFDLTGTSSTNVLVDGGSFSYNKQAGINLMRVSDAVFRNFIADNNAGASGGGFGVKLDEWGGKSQNILFEKFGASGNGLDGITIQSEKSDAIENVTVQEAILTGNARNGANLLYVNSGSNDPEMTAVSVRNSYLAGNGNLGAALYAWWVAMTPTETFDVSGNWWGDSAPAGVQAAMSADSLDFSPWLGSSTDMEPGTPGFQGDFSSLWVDDDSPQKGGGGHIQEGIDMVTGSTVHVAAGTYLEALNITTPGLEIIGDDEATVIVDPTGMAFDNAGIYVNADDVTLQSFTLNSTVTTSLPRYGIKVADVDGCTLEDVTATEVYRSGVDCLGSSNLTLTNVTCFGNGGHGLALNDCNGVDVSNFSASGNGWQNVSVVTWGRYTPLGCSDIVFSGTNTFGDLFQLEMGDYNNPGVPPAGAAVITYSTNIGDGADVTVQASDFGYALHGEQDDSPDQARVWFFSTLANAAIIPGMGGAGHWTGNDMFIESLTDGTQLYVTPGCDIPAAIAFANPAGGTTINVEAGTYNQSPLIDRSLALVGSDAATTFVTGGIQIGGSFDGLLIENLTITGDAPGWKTSVIDSRPTTGPVSDITVRDCVLDGESVYGRYCFYGNFITGTWTFDGNEIKNFITWYVIDNTGSGHDVPYKIDEVYFVDNYVHGCGGSIAFRGKIDEPMDYAQISGNTMNDYLPSAQSECWAGIEINNVGSLDVFNNSINGVPEASWGGEGQPLQIWSASPWTVDIHDNDFSGNFQGIYVWTLLEDGLWSGPDTPLYIPGGSIYHNNFSGETVFGLWISDLPVGSGTSSGIGGPLDAEQNYWGYVAYNSILAYVSANIDFDPWCIDAGYTDCSLTYPVTEVWIDDAWAGSSEGDIVDGHVFGYNAFATVQDGVNGVQGSTVHINDGLYYTDAITITIPMTIIGQSRSGVVIAPANAFDGTTNPNTGFLIQSSDVTIQTLTIDGQANTSLTAGVNNFGTGIQTDYAANYGNLVVTDVTVQHIVNRGIQFYNPATPSSTGNSVTYCLIDDVTNYGGFSSWYADIEFSNNTVLTAGDIGQSGVAIRNVYSQAEIHDNEVDAAGGYFGILTYNDNTGTAAGGSMNCTGNTVNNAFYGIGTWGPNYIAGNTVTITEDDGIGLWSASNLWTYSLTNDIDFVGNTVYTNGNGAYAFNLCNQTAGNVVQGNEIYMMTSAKSGSGGTTAIPHEIGAPDAAPADLPKADRGSANRGIVMWWYMPDQVVTVQDNYIECDGSNSGILIYHTGPTQAPLLLNNELVSSASTSSVEHEGVGIMVTDFGDWFGESGGGDNTSAILRGNKVSGFVNGFYAYQGHGDDVTAMITDGNIFCNNATGANTNASTTTSLSVYGNTFCSSVNAIDNTTGSNWDDGIGTGNCWTDFESNSGYPTQYDVGGTSGKADHYPNIDCGLDLAPDDILSYCDANITFDVAIGDGIMGLEAANITIQYPWNLDFVAVTSASSNYYISHSLTDNSSGYDVLVVNMGVLSGSETGPTTLFTIELLPSDVCFGDLVSMTAADLRDSTNLPNSIPSPLAAPISITVDCEDPVLTVNTADGGIYNVPPTVNLEATDNCDLDAIFYQVDACAASGWLPLTTGLSGTTYGPSDWAMPAADWLSLSEAVHCVNFKVLDDNGRVNVDSCTNWCFTKDVTPPPPPTDLLATPGHNKVNLSWTNATSDFHHTVIMRTDWYAGGHGYPEYDDDNAEGPYPTDTADGDYILATLGASHADTDDISNSTRDVYHYHAFTVDAAGNASVPSNDARATSYWLGDLAGSGGLGDYDGSVYYEDLSVFSNAYGTSEGDTYYEPEADWGPTYTYSPKGIPTTDNQVEFEDLSIFAINFDAVSPLLAKDKPILDGISTWEQTSLSTKNWIDGGFLFVDVVLNNKTNQAKSLIGELSFDEEYLHFVSASMNQSLANAGVPVFFKALSGDGKVSIAAAVLGQELTFTGSGLIATLKFELGHAGATAVTLSRVDIRDVNNHKIARAVPINGTVTEIQIPATYSVAQNRPNPFNPNTTISFGLPKDSWVTLKVYNVTGQVVKTLVDQYQSAGFHQVDWDATNESGHRVASGIYFYRFETEGFAKTVKMTLMK